MKLRLPPNVFPMGPARGASENVLPYGRGKRSGLVSGLKRVDGERQLDGT